MIEVYGPESSGKTTLALQVVAEARHVDPAGPVVVHDALGQRALRVVLQGDELVQDPGVVLDRADELAADRQQAHRDLDMAERPLGGG